MEWNKMKQKKCELTKMQSINERKAAEKCPNENFNSFDKRIVCIYKL